MPTFDTCAICSRSVAVHFDGRRTRKSQKKTTSTEEETCHKFFSLLCRYLKITLVNFKPEQTLKNNTWNVSGRICDDCLPEIESFCQLYDEWMSLQLEMNQCLQDIVELTMNAGGYPTRKAKTRSITPSSSSTLEDIKRIILKLVNEKNFFPRLMLDKSSSLLSSTTDNTIRNEDILMKKETMEEVEEINSDAEDFRFDSSDFEYFPSPSPQQSEKEDHHSGRRRAELYCRFPVAPKQVETTSKKKGRKPGWSRRLVGKHECDLCKRLFFNQKILDKHMRLKHTNVKSKPFPCVMCSDQTSFSSFADLVRHMRTHTFEKPYSWDFCDDWVASASELALHIRMSHAGAKRFECSTCPKSFTSSTGLEDHMFTHLPKPYKCHLCFQTFVGKTTLECHLMKKHSNEVLQSCDVCKKEFPSLRILRKHRKTHELKQCSKCEFKNVSRAALRKHLAVEHGMEIKAEETHVCAECGATLKNKKSLEKHLVIHQQSKFQCPHCGKWFRHEQFFKVHIRNQHELKNRTPDHICATCGKGYLNKTSLDEHILMKHLSEEERREKLKNRWIQCGHCTEEFLRSSWLKRHIQSKHKDVGCFTEDTKINPFL